MGDDREMEFLENRIFNATAQQNCLLHLFQRQQRHRNSHRSCSPYFTPLSTSTSASSSPCSSSSSSFNDDVSVNYIPPPPPPPPPPLSGGSDASYASSPHRLWEKFQSLQLRDTSAADLGLAFSPCRRIPSAVFDTRLAFALALSCNVDHQLNVTSGVSKYHQLNALDIIDGVSGGGEDSFIIQGSDLHLHYVANADDAIASGGAGEMSLSGPILERQESKCLANLRGCIYFVAKNQQGCRFLQRKFDEKRAEDIEMIFGELVGHIAELMVNPFANYLMQKLFDVCTEDQRRRAVRTLTAHPFQLVRVSLNNHGTRAVQRLVETLTTHQQIQAIVDVLRPGYLVLIKDLNGHHVILRCLQCLAMEYNKHIFATAAEHCVEIASDQHGCCVLQRCLFYSDGRYQANLIMQIVENGFHLAQHPFGNYAVQFVMDMKNPVADRKLMGRLSGNYVHLSTNKFGSNVVEKCLKMWEDARDSIILELLSAPRFDFLLQDQYGNYVIQSALVNSKGGVQSALIEAIRPYEPVLRTNPYCKKIFSRPCFRR